MLQMVILTNEIDGKDMIISYFSSYKKSKYLN